MRIRVNGEEIEIDEESPTVAGIVERFGLVGRPVAVEVNREIVPKREHGRRTLSDGDTVELVTLVGGG